MTRDVHNPYRSWKLHCKTQGSKGPLLYFDMYETINDNMTNCNVGQGRKET